MTFLMIHQNLAITVSTCVKKYRVGRKQPSKEISVVDFLCRFNSKTTRIHAIYCVYCIYGVYTFISTYIFIILLIENKNKTLENETFFISVPKCLMINDDRRCFDADIPCICSL